MSKCSFGGCDEEVASKGLCMGHYKQQLKGKPLTPIDRDKDTRVRNNQKRCTSCKKLKHTREFYFRNMKNGELRSECIDCNKDKRKK